MCNLIEIKMNLCTYVFLIIFIFVFRGGTRGGKPSASTGDTGLGAVQGSMAVPNLDSEIERYFTCVHPYACLYIYLYIRRLCLMVIVRSSFFHLLIDDDSIFIITIISCDGTEKMTQAMLGDIITRPKLSDKLLSKPPFRFLFDIVLEVIKGMHLWMFGSMYLFVYMYRYI